MSSSHVHSSSCPFEKPTQKPEDHFVKLAIPPKLHDPIQSTVVDYASRTQWLRAAVLGANDGLVSVASLMIGVGAASRTPKAMLVSGLAELVAGACSMVIGEFVSVYTQYDIEAAHMWRQERKGGSTEPDAGAVMEAE
ncbi:vacuolar iron transporter [Canna indica]|uniref:Vacuolar iron transporter n=1 Tax=Canna indica TaxID=4628 RepID=A0AAQ3QAN1_9LILI|nr:vacuolar iron transporter [Canna indica]